MQQQRYKMLPVIFALMVTVSPAIHAQDRSSMDVNRTDVNPSKDAQLMLLTLSENKTEVQHLAAQAQRFMDLGGRQNRRIASLFHRWIREHKRAGDMLVRVTLRQGGYPLRARVLSSPVLGDRMEMLHAVALAHHKSVDRAQMRWGLTNDPAVKQAMHQVAALARRHLRELRPYHNESMAHRVGRNNTIRVTARNHHFYPSMISAWPGQPVRVVLVNEGLHPHNIEFELPSGEEELPHNVLPGQTAMLDLTAPSRAGRYVFYCPVGDHKSDGMVGTLIVR